MQRESPASQQPKRPAAEIQFVAVKSAIMRGAEHIATAVSTTMATRIARALNRYRPGPRGY